MANLTNGKSDRIMPQANQPVDPDEWALVIKALTSELGGCVEWKSDLVERRVRDDRSLAGLRPQHIRKDLIDSVKESPASVVQVLEKRPEFIEDYRFYYKVILTYENLPFEVFVELVLNDPDPDCPAVCIVNAHPQ